MPANTATTTNEATEENNAPTTPPIERLVYNAREAASALGISHVTLWRLSKRGLLNPIPGLRHRLYSVAALRRFAERGSDRRGVNQ